MEIKDVCRTCLLPGSTMLPIFGSIQNANLQYTELPILSILKLFTEISDSRACGLPENICRECFEKLHQFYAFKLKFEKSEAIWNQLIEDEKTVKKCSEYEQYTEVNFDLLKTEKIQEHITLNDEKLERTSLSEVIEPGIVKQEMFLVQEVKQETEIEINTNEGDFNETDTIEKCSKSDLQYQRKLIPKTRKRKTKYKCTICSKMFVSNSQLNRHMIKHTRGGPFQCGVCLKKIRYKSKLDRHMRIVHGGETQFKCTICPRKCVNNSMYKKHMIMHTRYGKFQCKICRNKFCYKKDLYVHMEKVHGDETKMKFKCASAFKCATCSKSFACQSYLNRHLIVHTDEKPFQCEICQKKIRSKGSLTVHMRTVHGDKTTKDFKCPTCSKLYRHNSSLKQHMLIHTGEKPFECEVCSRKFVYKNCLMSHMRRMHSVKSQSTLP